MAEPDITRSAKGSVKAARAADSAAESALIPDDVTTEPAILRRLIVLALRDNLGISEEAAERVPRRLRTSCP
ncbi:hypothetical protein [Streptomyces sp. NPDC059564]|uniref:hypothetical protein n=1 Tax=Streptomyces sp. NPDC059564 TaxID=3346865 RepID=UPI00368182FD